MDEEARAPGQKAEGAQASPCPCGHPDYAHDAAMHSCQTDGCGGDGRHAAPGHGHREGCRWPLTSMSRGS